MHTCGKRGSPGSAPERRRSSEQRRCLRDVEEVADVEEVVVLVRSRSSRRRGSSRSVVDVVKVEVFGS